MKREDVKAVFPEADDEQVDAVLDKAGDDLNQLERQLKSLRAERDEARGSVEEALSREAELKARLREAEAEIEVGMTAEERVAAREAAAEEREREYLIKSNGLDAREVFVAAGCFDSTEIGQLVEQVVSDESELTRQRAQRIVDTVARQREAVERQTKDALLRENPRLGGGVSGAPGAPATMGEFLALPGAEQIALKEANPGILSELKR